MELRIYVHYHYYNYSALENRHSVRLKQKIIPQLLCKCKFREPLEA